MSPPEAQGAEQRRSPAFSGDMWPGLGWPDLAVQDSNKLHQPLTRLRVRKGHSSEDTQRSPVYRVWLKALQDRDGTCFVHH